MSCAFQQVIALVPGQRRVNHLELDVVGQVAYAKRFQPVKHSEPRLIAHGSPLLIELWIEVANRDDRNQRILALRRVYRVEPGRGMDIQTWLVWKGHMVVDALEIATVVIGQEQSMWP